MTVRGFVKEACIKVPNLRTEIGYKAVAAGEGADVS